MKSRSPALGEVVAALEAVDGGWALDAPPSWSQGRTLYGGMTAALCWAAVGRSVPGLPPVRSAQFTFVGPASGRLNFKAELLRKGRSAAVVAVEVVGQAGIAARALFTCGAARESRVEHRHEAMPAVAAPADCEAFIPGGGFGPDFAENFDLRLAGGSRPYCGAPPEMTVWTRLNRADGVDPLVGLLALADALPPAAMALFPAPGVISTMSWSVDIEAQPEGAQGWFLQRSVAEHSSEGYSSQAMELWDAGGRRIIAARQTVAIFV